MQKFVPGQRWISNSESQMGLGTVSNVDFRRVTIIYQATGETRTYAAETAPLTRVVFSPGDKIKSLHGWSIDVESVDEKDGLLTYSGLNDLGELVVIPESELDSFIQLSQPLDRLLSGQIDQNKWFELHYRCLLFANELGHSDMYGYVGTRTSLIPHQLYIAHEVANRFAPRVLLADEVGLGKTIEAGMILHHQLITYRAQRVLIVVPENLVHQWLVEMLRRFNLYFAIFDDDRFEGEKESAGQENPFFTEQLVLCNLNFLVNNEEHFAMALKGNWDLLVVDEAHHLEWSPQQPSREYECIEQLAKVTKGVLLLTATPEQLGKQSHFARLRLLDPDRFPDYDSFIEEEAGYEPVAAAIDDLIEKQTLGDQAIRTLTNVLQHGDDEHWLRILKDQNSENDQKILARLELVNHLLDRHGTGRVLFRNTRTAIKGFPVRKLISYPLRMPDQYQAGLANSETELQYLLNPELLYFESDSKKPNWSQVDPRIDWIINLLAQVKPDKVLVIASNIRTVLKLSEALRVKKGIHAAVFHEHMTIVERDRAAAYFAEHDAGSQVLICSEIGSEGRNFQFTHHLVLFDLPLNPDLLEQRIGRLDRIGQKETIKIHVPYLENTAAALLFRWYHDGLNAFENTSATGATLFGQFKDELMRFILQKSVPESEWNQFLIKVRELNDSLNESLHRGRDRLLEINSCREDIATKLTEKASAIDANGSLLDFMEQVFDCFGVEVEDHSRKSYVLHPGDHMQVGSFPSLNPEGMTITFDRETALSNEDMHFMTWEHPMVTGAMDLILNQEIGNSTMVTIKHKSFEPGNMLAEAIYLLESVSKDAMQHGRYFPVTTIRTVVDDHGKNFSEMLSHDMINNTQASISEEIMLTIVRSHSDNIKSLVSRSELLVKDLAPKTIDLARKNANFLLQEEIDRLQDLKRINPNIRQDEIDYFLYQQQNMNNILDNVVPRLKALRIIICT